MKKHLIWMIIGCNIPLLLIFLAPSLGLGSGIPLFIFILAMFACHLLMPMHHHGGHEHSDNNESPHHSTTLKKENHEHVH